MPRVALAVALVAIAAVARAQELRQIDCPMFQDACFDAFRQRVIAPSIAGYSQEWDGTVWRMAADIGASQGFCYVDTATARLHVIKRTWTGSGYQLAFVARIGSAWQTVPSPGGPSLRNDMALAYDTSRGEVLAFGGYSTTQTTPLGDTWVWNGSSWAQRLVAGPTPRANSTVAYDSVRQRVVLFGGYTTSLSSSSLDDTWEWNGASWTQVPTPNRPAPRLRASAAYDPARQRIVMIGPAITPGYPVQHWEYDGTTWFPGPALPTGTSSLQPKIVHDAARAETLLLGGDGPTGVHGRVWAWNGVAWSPRSAFGDLPYQSFGSEVAPEAGGNGIVMFGPYSTALPGPSDELWTFDGTSWSLTAAGGPPARQDPLLWTMQGDTFLFGGNGAPAMLNDLWRWDGTSWTQLAPAVNPPPRSRSACAVDTNANRVVIFGGSVASGWTNDTWTFDGVVWQQVFGGPSPTPRYLAAMAFDPVRNKTVLFGGFGGPSGTTQLTDTWQWDGATWQQVVTSPVPPPAGRMTFDWTSQRVLYFAPTPNSTALYQAWAFDGVTWSLVPMLGTAGSANPLRASLPRPVTTATGSVFVVDQWSGVHALLRSPARAANLGQACGPAPLVLSAASLPRLGDTSFAIDVLGAPNNGPVAIAGADAPASLPFFGCTLLVAGNQACAVRTASPTGFVSVALPLPASSTLLGQSFWFQAAALSPASANGFTLSQGLRIDLGQ